MKVKITIIHSNKWSEVVGERKPEVVEKDFSPNPKRGWTAVDMAEDWAYDYTKNGDYELEVIYDIDKNDKED